MNPFTTLPNDNPDGQPHPELERLLAQSTPQADSAFQQRLEDELVSRLAARRTNIPANGRLTTAYRTLPRRRIALPLTLAAALFAAVMAGAVLLSMGALSEPDFVPGAQVTETAEPAATATPLPTTPGFLSYVVQEGDTLEGIAARFSIGRQAIINANLGIHRHPERIPVGTTLLLPLVSAYSEEAYVPGLRNVVVAVQDICFGTTITLDMLSLVYWPESTAPVGSAPNLSSLVGRIAVDDIAQWQPILAAQIADNSALPADSAILPDPMVAVLIQIDQLNSVSFDLVAGDQVDVIATLTFPDTGNGFANIQPLGTPYLFPGVEPRGTFESPPANVTAQATPAAAMPTSPSSTQRIIPDALIIAIEESSAHTPSSITLGVSPQDAVMLNWMAEAKMQLTLLENTSPCA